MGLNLFGSGGSSSFYFLSSPPLLERDSKPLFRSLFSLLIGHRYYYTSNAADDKKDKKYFYFTQNQNVTLYDEMIFYPLV